MSLAIPSSFSEYLFDQGSRIATPAMICNGGIMPERSYLQSAGTNYRNCLRGEDVFFLKEGVFARAAMTDANYSPSGGILSSIQFSELNAIKAAMVAVKGKWQSSAPTVPAYDFGATEPEDEDIEDWIYSQFSGMGTLACQFDSWDGLTRLRSLPISHLFTDIGKMNYGMDAQGKLSLYYSQGVESDWTRYNRYSEPQTETGTDSHYNQIWHSAHEVYYVNGSTKERELTNVADDETITLDVAFFQYGNWEKIVDVLPLAVIQVTNHWDWYNYSADTSDASTDENHWVIVPLTQGYNQITGADTPLAIDADAVIEEAFQTAGFSKDWSGINIGTTPSSGTWGEDRYAYAKIVSIWNLVKFKYCVP